METPTTVDVRSWSVNKLTAWLDALDLGVATDVATPRVVLATYGVLSRELLNRLQEACDRDAWTRGVYACDRCGHDLLPSAPRCEKCRRASPFFVAKDCPFNGGNS